MKQAVVASLLAVLIIVAAVAIARPGVAQTRDHDIPPGIFRGFGRGAEIGVSIRELTSDDVSRAKLGQPGGVLVVGVRDGSPAARAGVRSGDVIVTFDGERVRGVRHFSRLVLETPAGRTVQSEIVRDGNRQTLTVTPEETEGLGAVMPEIRREIERSLRSLPRDLEFPPFPQRSGRAWLGLTLAPLTDQLASYFGVKEGVLVSAVEPSSAAAHAGIQAGDVITAIDGRSVRTAADVAASVRTARGGLLEVRLVRDKKEMSVKVTVPEGQLRGTEIPV